MASTTMNDTSLLSLLETSTSAPISSLFTSYLSPFTDLLKPQTKTLSSQTTTIRSLAKQYLRFLNKSLSILPKRLSKASNLNQPLILELFEVYRLCLDCLDLVSSQLSCKPWTVQVQRLRLVHCYEVVGKYAEGEKEGFRVLNNLRLCGKLDSDKELALVAVEVVAVIVKCVAMERSKDSEVYRKVLTLVKEIRPCFEVLDASIHEKFHRLFTTNLGKCTLFLVLELTSSSGDLVREFCSAVLSEYAKSSMRDQIYKFSCRLCSSLFSLEDSRDLLIRDLLISVLRSTANACKVHSDMEFVELVSYCANKCRASGTIRCSSIAGYLIELADDFSQVMRPIDLILKIYATGLHFISCSFKSQVGESNLVIEILKDDGDGKYNVAALLNSLESYFHNNSNVTSTCIKRIGKANWLSYINALRFLCMPLAELVNSEKKQILAAEFEATGSMLLGLQDIFHQFCKVFHSMCSFTSEKEREEFADNKSVLSVAVANFTLSVSTNVKLKESVNLIKQIISSDWIEQHDLKRLLVSLYNIGVHLLKVTRIVLKTLENWCVAGNLFDSLPGPMSLVKQWVKIACKLQKNVNTDDSDFSLSCVLASSDKVSKRMIGIILEQELQAYADMSPYYPELSRRMQMKIIDILLGYMDGLQKSRILLRKARTLRSCGIERLRDSIQCLTEAISIMNNLKTPPSHQLASAYCLRALCNQEAEPSSKQILVDMEISVDIWLSLSIPEDCTSDDTLNVMSENMLFLLYNTLDLLCMKGHVKVHRDIYELFIRLFRRKNVPLEKFVLLLWGCRRLSSHALCVSPVNETFIMKLSEHYGEHPRSIDFWINSFKGSEPLTVGFEQIFSFLFANFPHGVCVHESSFQLDITADDVKKTASELLVLVPESSHSTFFAGHLYYDLCERLISNGRLCEALSYAKEAHKLRTKLFQENFRFSVEQNVESIDEAGDKIEKVVFNIKNFQVYKSSANEVWSFDSISWEIDRNYLSPWSVLQSYLESILQLAIILELIGNGVEAEAFLLWGKSVSCLQSLSLFTVAFSSVLGKIYRKKQHLMLAERELQTAEQTLVNNDDFACIKCKLILEASVKLQLGDLYRTNNVPAKTSSHAYSLYMSALDKLNISEWKNSITCPEEGSSQTMFPEKKMEKIAAKKPRNKSSLKTLAKEKVSLPEQNGRVTRSKYRSSQNSKVGKLCEEQYSILKHSESNTISNYTHSQTESLLETKTGIVDFGSDPTCICKNLKCWNCLPLEVLKSGMIKDFILVKWEFVRRQLALRLLTCIGKCLGDRDEIHEIHDTVVQTQLPGDVFAVGRAAILYSLSWFSLKHYHSKDDRSLCCDLSRVQLSQVVSWLKLAFVLCREVPTLFQKVARLLAVTYIFSTSSEQYSLASSSKVIPENYWASFYHQASLGANLDYHFFSIRSQRCKTQHLVNSKGLHATGSVGIGAETHKLIRLAPDSISDLDQFVTDFFTLLPSSTIICMSLLGSAYAKLIGKFTPYPSIPNAWMLVSRLNSKGQPVAVLLPVNSISEDFSNDDETCSCGKTAEGNSANNKHWHCPWGSSVVDDVAPAFRMILEENYFSSSVFPLEDTEMIRKLWWDQRNRLDSLLGKLLRKLEDSWFGQWRFLLQGEWSNSQSLDTVLKKVVRNLKSKCKVDANETLLRLILQGSSFGFEQTFISHLHHKKCCNVACHEESCEPLVNSSHQEAFQIINEAISELDEASANIEPIILVMDSEVQMLPWENLPILRNQEVYRMPSVASILAALNRSCQDLDQVGEFANFPLVDPLDAFYLLNPSGDLNDTQDEFESWFKDWHLEGKAGSAPPAEELAVALKIHDLFIYFGHGSGSQYIKKDEIQKLEKCAATLLMGCSSGSLKLNGRYIPQGMPLTYLLGGSPITIANLWEVTDKDIDRFGKAMLDSWIKERTSSINCSECDSVAKQLEALSLKGNAKKKASRKKLTEDQDSNFCKGSCNHRPKIGSFIIQAREACKLPFLVGAAPVCYGVPTCIRKKKDY
ncbi:hypothetical protein ACFE04_022700 [Oxalis oulophora]